MKELPALQESSDAVKLGAGVELCHHTAEDCRQMEHSFPSCVMEAVKIEPRDEQQSNCDLGLPAGFLEVEKEEPFFMEEDSTTVTDFKPFQIPFVGLDSLKAEPVEAGASPSILQASLKAEPVEAGASPSILQASPANQELPTRAGIFTDVPKASETACLASTTLEVHNCGASMALPPSETSTSKGKSQTNEMEISSTEQESGEACSPNNGRLSPTSAPSVNCNVLSYNGTRTNQATQEASFKGKEAHNSLNFKRSKHLCIKFKKCSVLLTRIHVSENYKFVCSEGNENNICSEEIAFLEPHPKHGSKDLERPKMRSENLGKSGEPNSSEENELNFCKNTDSVRRTSLNRSKRLNASMREVISSTTSHVRRNKEKTLKCHVCAAAFRFKWQLVRHINAVHLKLRPHKCSKCDYASSEVTYLQTHLNSAHAELKQFKCTVCCINFSSPAFLQLHVINAHSAATKFQLDSYFAGADLMVKYYKCSDCTYAATSKNNLNSHIKHVHLKIKPQKCAVRAYAVTTENVIRGHIAVVHQKLRLYKCHECAYATAVKSRLTLHIKAVHLKIKPFKCDECDSSFSIKSNLTAHISSVHLKDRTHSCPHCSYSSCSKAGLATHIAIVHLELKPHKCPQCDFTGSSKGNLDYHVNAVHLKLRPHKCQTCKRGFYQKAHLEQHMKLVHMNLREHKCSQCDYAAGSRGDLTRHVDVVHLKIKKYECGVCEYSAAKKSGLISHVARKH
ncbi:zinc finger protein 85-like isoform X2 [Hyalella azteca]|uniref:Zinc finger protein 85-like isoform X2 n=1 Tax=Hyalella azteca TaxID=294128 RepID=A0A8B7N736_HYAAZ|nr:zinc finger protein 85-like isoform X2 [Hyalella azteca]